MPPAVLVQGMRDDIYSLSSLLRANEHTGSPGKVAIFTESGAVILESDSCQELLQHAIHQGSQTHVADQVDGIDVLRRASITTMAHVHLFIQHGPRQSGGHLRIIRRIHQA